MQLHEYQAKEILRELGIPVPVSFVCREPQEVGAACDRVGFPCVVKAQVHAGGRGKAGGVRVVRGSEEGCDMAVKLLGRRLVTSQTVAEGQAVHCLLVERGCEVAREFYVGLVLDRQRDRMCLMGCAQGGMEIEEVAASRPEAIVREWIDPVVGLMPYQARRMAWSLGCGGGTHKQIVSVLQELCRAGALFDATLLEINPLVITKQEEVAALDAKMTVDESALFRQSRMARLRDASQEDEREVEAGKHNLSYVALTGNIGCMVNGAGLAMATMDMIQHEGGQPANFLDIGGSATQDRVRHALRLIVRDKAVRAVLINVFGGIVRCDMVARGIVGAAREVGVAVPLVVRLRGTRAQEGKAVLAASGLSITPVDTLLEAARTVVAHAA
ncbi:MAG: ADP-forming succinate--CoA ligase subunit beta [Myxococcota bacterium]